MKFEIDSLVKILLRILSVKGWGGGERLAAEFRPYFTLLNEQKSGAVVISSAIRERGEEREAPVHQDPSQSAPAVILIILARHTLATMLPHREI